MIILLSIKPEFVNKIISGEKKYEYRRIIPTKNIDKVVIYETAPSSKVVGEFEVSDIISGKLSEVWHKTSDYSGITSQFYYDYFKGKNKAYAYKIKDLKVYEEPKTLEDIGIKSAPQSFIYIKNTFNTKRRDIVNDKILKLLTYEEYWKEICDKMVEFVLKDKGKFKEFKTLYSKQYIDTDFNNKKIKELYCAIEKCCNILPDIKGE